MAIRVIGICLGTVLCAGCGGTRQEESVPSYVDEHVAAIKRTLTCAGNGINLQTASENTMNMFCSLSNSVQRIRAIPIYSDMLLAVDLMEQPYCVREWSTGQYGSCICHCYRIMGKCGVDPAESMEWFFACLAKFKCLCLSVPDAERLPGETMAEARLRRHCLHLFRSDYEHHISIIRRFWIPRLSQYLPEKYHAEFVRRLNSLTCEGLKENVAGELHGGLRSPTPIDEKPLKIVSPVIMRTNR